MQRTRTTYNFSPELVAQLEAQLRQGRVVRADATARVSSGQTTQQVRRKKQEIQFQKQEQKVQYVRANDFGQLNRYTEHYNPDFSDLFINSKGNIPEGAKVIRVGNKYFFQNKEGRIMGSIRERTPEQIINERLPGSNQKSPNEWIKQINEEFKLNIPLARVNPKGQIEWPNLYGVLYKKGGFITS